MTNEKKSDAVKHLEKIADRHNEHLESLLEVRKIISKMPLVKKGKGAFNNPYLQLPDIIEQIEPLLLEHGFITIFDDWSSDIDLKEGQCKFVLKLIYVPTNEITHNYLTVKLEKATPQGKRSAYTYAMRSLYCTVLAIPTTDDDGTDTMTIDEFDKAIDSLKRQKAKLMKNGGDVKGGKVTTHTASGDF